MMLMKVSKFFKVILGVSIPVLVWWLLYTPITRENALLKLGIGFSFVTFIAPVLTFYIKLKAKQKIYESNKPQPKKKLELKHGMELKEYQKVKETYFKERQQYYLEARELFGILMKSGMLKRNDIQQLKTTLEGYLEDYMDEYKSMQFKNDAHRIYVYLKSYFINSEQWQELIAFLKDCETKNVQSAQELNPVQ
jgi:hypothetical protein